MTSIVPSDSLQTGQPRRTRPESLLDVWLPVILISSVGIFLCYSIWGKTGEMLLDFGNEQYIAWQISQGKVLFSDVSCLYGPLSPNLNAIVMRMAGTQFNTI